MRETYEQLVIHYRKQQLAVMSKRRILSLLRVLSFLLTGFAAYVAFTFSVFLGLTSIVIGISIFLVLVKRHLEAKAKYDFLSALERINKAEIGALDGNYSVFEDGKNYLDGQHDYMHDLDLFGDRSIFQCLNRTVTNKGRDKLAYELANSYEIVGTLSERQKAISELSALLDWRQEFGATGMVAKTEDKEYQQLMDWNKDQLTGFNSLIFKLQIWVLPVTGIGAIATYNFDLITMFWLILYFCVPGFCVSRYLRITNRQSVLIGGITGTLRKFQRLSQLIESQNFKSELLCNIKSELLKDGSASKEVNALVKIANRLDNRINPLLGFILNLLLVWDLSCLKSLSAWKNRNSTKLNNWLNAIHQMDALISFANFTRNNEGYCVPQIGNTIFSVERIGHPLLLAKNRVDNNYSLNSVGDFSIITGANMAGKSTFLRAVGVNLILAMCGSVVCATKFTFQPTRLFTSMRTTDSLQDNESYFYTELKRLKMLISKLDSGEPLFIILDEILKGTNSKDKAEGSKLVLEKILKKQATGIIATHDLSLCEIENAYPENIRNYSFDARIKGKELIFDYKIRDGVCQNMNASFLMQQMGIV